MLVAASPEDLAFDHTGSTQESPWSNLLESKQRMIALRSAALVRTLYLVEEPFVNASSQAKATWSLPHLLVGKPEVCCRTCLGNVSSTLAV